MTNQHATEEQERQETEKTDLQKRQQVIKTLAVSGLAVTAWNKPIVNSLILPAHAQTTTPAQTTTAPTGSGTGTASVLYSYNDTDGTRQEANAPFNYRVSDIDTATGAVEIEILPDPQTASLLPETRALDYFIQPAISQTNSRLSITGGTLTGTIDLTNGGASTAAGSIRATSPDGESCTITTSFTLSYNAVSKMIEFDQSQFTMTAGGCNSIGTVTGFRINTRPKAYAVAAPTATTPAPTNTNAINQYNARGQKHGTWIEPRGNGTETGEYVNGQKQGIWTAISADGTVSRGQYVDGREHQEAGEGAERRPDGSIWTSTWVNGVEVKSTIRTLPRNTDIGINQYNARGQKHGTWIEKTPWESTATGEYVNGQKQGIWLERWASGEIARGPYVNNKEHGTWIETKPNGNTVTSEWVNGKISGDILIKDRNGSIIRTIDDCDGETSTNCSGGNPRL